MRHIGDDYYEFKCKCGDFVLVRLGDTIHYSDVFLCSKCGENFQTTQFGKKLNALICELCRARLTGDIPGVYFPTIHEDGEATIICVDCLCLDDNNEKWKKR